MSLTISTNLYNVNPQRYTESLIQIGIESGLISEVQLTRIQSELHTLLKELAFQYTYGESSSVKIEVAATLTQSILFAISLYLKRFSNHEKALEHLITQNLRQLYKSGTETLNSKIKLTKALHQQVLRIAVKTPNRTYKETLYEGMRGFFKIYDARFDGLNYKITADYPLAVPVTEKDGIEFIEAYLLHVYFENLFCSHFSSLAIHGVLRSAYKHYTELVINIFEHVISAAVGCALASKPILPLVLKKAEIERLYIDWTFQNDAEIEVAIQGALGKVVSELSIENAVLIDYLERFRPTLTEQILTARSLHRLERIFYAS